MSSSAKKKSRAPKRKRTDFSADQLETERLVAHIETHWAEYSKQIDELLAQGKVHYQPINLLNFPSKTT
jgi:hypothetical protein